MNNKDSTLKDIKAGKGLKPIPSDGSANKSGITTEKRESMHGIRHERFAYNTDTTKKVKKNE